MKEDWFQNNLTVEEEELRIRVVSSSARAKSLKLLHQSLNLESPSFSVDVEIIFEIKWCPSEDKTVVRLG
jgi:hypothetical protein